MKMKKIKKFALIGAASVGGGVLVGLTGGLVAPLVGASLAALLGTYKYLKSIFFFLIIIKLFLKT
jgi:hypothetical protein